MAKASKETLQVVTANMALCSNKPSDDAKSRVLVFQADEVVVDGPIELYLPASQYLNPLSEEQIFEYNGSVKFTISNSVYASDKCFELRKLKPKDYAKIRYGVAPQSSRIDNNTITYARTKFLAVLVEEDETETKLTDDEVRRRATARTSAGSAVRTSTASTTAVAAAAAAAKGVAS